MMYEAKEAIHTPSRGVFNSHANLNDNLLKLDKALVMLGETLIPVTRNTPQGLAAQYGETPVRQPTCSLDALIQDACEKVGGFIQYVEDRIERTEL